MWKQKLCLNLIRNFGLSEADTVRLYHAVGFDGFFAHYDGGDFPAINAAAKETGMLWQSVHAPFHRADALWLGSREEREEALAEQLACVEACARYEVPLMVTHAFIGHFNTVGAPTPEGLDCFSRLLDRAEKSGVRIALENTEGEEYLAALFENFGGHPAIGFCLDVGHEVCYNHSQDLLALYGRHLAGTHLNDNLGISRADGAIAPTDDLHLPPFEGVIDWARTAARLNAVGFAGPLTFELKIVSKQGRHENDVYAAMPPEQFATEAYKRACRVAALRSL